MFGRTMASADIKELKVVVVDCHDHTGVAPDLRVEKKSSATEVFLLEAQVVPVIFRLSLPHKAIRYRQAHGLRTCLVTKACEN